MPVLQDLQKKKRLAIEAEIKILGAPKCLTTSQQNSKWEVWSWKHEVNFEAC